MVDEGELSDVYSTEKQKSHGLALFFEQKLNAHLLTRSGELEMVSESRTPLTEYVHYGYSTVYGGHYFIVPLHEESTGQINAALVYPLTDGDDLTLSGDLDKPLLLDEASLNAVQDSCRFLLSNKFLSWKKEGLSVSCSLYAYAESLDGKSIFTPSSYSTVGNISSLRGNLTRSEQDYPYEATICINYNMTPYVYGEGIGVTASLPSIEARRNVVVSTFEHLEFVDGVGACELTSIGAEYLHLEMTVSGIGVVEEAVQFLMIVSASRFQSEYGIEEISYYYDYTLTLDSDIISVGSGVGGGNVGEDTGGNSFSPSLQLISPTGDLSQAIFSAASRLTQEQWTIVENSLNNISSDCLGGKLIGEVYGKDILFVHDPTIEANGRYNHETNKLTIKSFDSLRIRNKEFEQTLLHELLHSVQENNQAAKLNLEIEVHVAVYRYAIRNHGLLSDSLYNNMNMFVDTIDSKYQIIDSTLYNEFYARIIQDFQEHLIYNTYPESEDSRNLHTLQRLGEDC